MPAKYLRVPPSSIEKTLYVHDKQETYDSLLEKGRRALRICRDLLQIQDFKTLEVYSRELDRLRKQIDLLSTISDVDRVDHLYVAEVFYQIGQEELLSATVLIPRHHSVHGAESEITLQLYRGKTRESVLSFVWDSNAYLRDQQSNF